MIQAGGGSVKRKILAARIPKLADRCRGKA